MFGVLLKSAYQRLHSHLPVEAGERLSDLVFSVMGRPRIYHDSLKHPQQRLRRGAVTFSLDFEMAWAFQYSKVSGPRCVELGLRERQQVPKILALFDKYSVPATWATVGHLCLEQCKRNSIGLAHSEIARCGHFENEHWKFTTGDWFQNDPCTDAHQNPAWYAPDLVEAIVSARVGHELASHTFSHAGFGSYCPAEVARAELDNSIEAMKPYGVRPTTLVFPGNDIGWLDVVAAKGFRIVRAFPHPTAEISLPMRINNDLWGVHSSTVVDGGTGTANLERRLFILKTYVDKAVASNLAAHFWFHPSLTLPRLHALLFPLVEYCAKLREQGSIDILTMEGLVNETESALLKQGSH